MDNVDISVVEQQKSQESTHETKSEEEEKFVNLYQTTHDVYRQHGARSSKKTDNFHNGIKEMIENAIDEIKNKNKNLQNTYTVKTEYDVSSTNASGKKRCDIVIFKNDEPFIALPVKVPMTTFKKNKNNSWENLSGELMHIKWANPDIKLIPINVYCDKIPSLKCVKSEKVIKTFECVSKKDIYIYNVLTEKGIAYDQINYIMCVEHSSSVGESYNKMPIVKGVHPYTPYRSLNDILTPILV